MPEPYDCLIVDAVNFAYRTFSLSDDSLIQVSSKNIYKNSICKFINELESLKKQYLDPDHGQIYLLFDNYFSRADLRSSFIFADRKQLSSSYKATRSKENKEFYQSLNFLRYFYIINKPQYHTLRIDNLEADDLVKPLIDYACKDKRCLLVTNDLDWTRSLNDKIDWLPNRGKEPQTVTALSEELGFKATEMSIVTYKALFGDASDNIQGIVNKTEKHLNEFKSLIKEITFSEELVLLSRDNDAIKRYPMLKAIAEDERRFSVNVQLVSSIPCSVQYVIENLTDGNNSETVLKAVKKIIGLEDTKAKFMFGGVKRPRV